MTVLSEVGDNTFFATAVSIYMVANSLLFVTLLVQKHRCFKLIAVFVSDTHPI